MCRGCGMYYLSTLNFKTLRLSVMKLYRGFKKGETWPLCISPNVLQNNPIKLLFRAFCSQLEPSSSSFFLKSPLSINFTSRFNVRQDGWRRNTTVHIEPSLITAETSTRIGSQCTAKTF